MNKPVAIEQDAITDDKPIVRCPRCRGFGRNHSDKDDPCNLCDGNGEVFAFGDGSYSNVTDKARYYW